MLFEASNTVNTANQEIERTAKTSRPVFPKKEKAMNQDKPLVNRVAQSGLITLKLEEYLPAADLVRFELKYYLFKELLLREKDFRAAMNEHDWSQYQGKALLVYCSSDAIIPIWAYMLVASHAAPYADDVFQGTDEAYYQAALTRSLAALNPADYEDARIVIKGCSDRPVPLSAYVELTRLLRPHARSIMYGEPCSTVPIYKKPRP